MHIYGPAFEDLPTRLPVFPLAGVLLLPHGQLPLNVFEPRYRRMIDDVLGTHRMIGIIQPRTACNSTNLYDVGCAGRIVNFTENEDGRYLITLAGICRFKIQAEIDVADGKPYRTITPLWAGYNADMAPQTEKVAVDRARLNSILKTYFSRQEMSCDWDKVDITADADLLTALAMICPLQPSEKQALLESANVQTRTELFMTMIEMAARDMGDCDDTCCH